MKKDKTKKVIFKILKILFILSLLYYVFWIILSIKYSITGLSSQYVGMHIESLCNHIHTTYYGFEAFCAGIKNCIMYTTLLFWFIPLYQFLFIVLFAINKAKNKKTNN